MAWQAVAALLACARIGAVHSVVFAGFSAEALRDRINDCKSRVVLTSDEGRRGGKSIATKAIVDSALKQCPLVEHVVVLRRTGNDVSWTQGRDKWWHEETARVPSYCPPVVMSAEDPLFILYVRYLHNDALQCESEQLFARPPAQLASLRVSCTRQVDTCLV
jgi:acetyl-CoA synthetase